MFRELEVAFEMTKIKYYFSHPAKAKKHLQEMIS